MESMNNVEKTLIHISHLHPLKLVASPEPRPICHACNMPCADQSYGCVPCYYFLHNTCATTGRSMNHPSHPSHTLNLELTPAYLHGQYACDACGVDGSSFCLRCRECSYDLHLPCADVPHQVNNSSHHHPLTLVYTNPYLPDIEFTCDMCENLLDCNKWFYLCSNCDFGGHVQCFLPETLEVLSAGLQASPPDPHVAALESVNKTQTDLLRIQSAMSRVQLLNQAMQFQTQIMRNSFI